jgi:broad specificity phosphatase PhoE
MATQVLMIEAGPTPWDAEGRMVGSRPLPLTAEALDAIRHLLDDLRPGSIASVYRPAANEACNQTAHLIAKKFNLRVRDNPALEEVKLGLWEGLAPEEVKFRFPTVFPQWLEHPLSVTPPDGEPLPDAIARIDDALKRILRRNRGVMLALALRPMAMQIASGLLANEPVEKIAERLHQHQPIATIEVN